MWSEWPSTRWPVDGSDQSGPSAARSNPPRNRSCQEILHCFPSAPSGYHEIRVPNGSLVQVYCDMEGTNCGGQGGWMRVAHVNMSQSGVSCPQELTQKVKSELTLCGQSATGGQRTLFSELGLSYSQVCGQLQGYQFATTDAFEHTIVTLLLAYVDGEHTRTDVHCVSLDQRYTSSRVIFFVDHSSVAI